MQTNHPLWIVASQVTNEDELFAWLTIMTDQEWDRILALLLEQNIQGVKQALTTIMNQRMSTMQWLLQRLSIKKIHLDEAIDQYYTKNSNNEIMREE
jgi:hypothetical protein